MELDYEKDVIKLMKLLAYHIKGLKYRNPQITDLEEFFQGPWIDITLSEKELADVDIPLSRAKLLVPAVYQKQGMNPNDFIVPQFYPDDETPLEVTHISVDTLFWIEDIVKNIESGITEINNPELVRKDFDKKNSITLNGLTGDYSYNKTSGTMKLNSRKFKLLRALLRTTNDLVTYDEIAKLLFNADQYNKAKHSKGLSEALDDLKRELKILGEKVNMDCFENITGTGYRLSLRQTREFTEL